MMCNTRPDITFDHYCIIFKGIDQPQINLILFKTFMTLFLLRDIKEDYLRNVFIFLSIQ